LPGANRRRTSAGAAATSENSDDSNDSTSLKGCLLGLTCGLARVAKNGSPLPRISGKPTNSNDTSETSDSNSCDHAMETEADVVGSEGDDNNNSGDKAQEMEDAVNTGTNYHK
jgi:hypothetical protein